MLSIALLLFAVLLLCSYAAAFVSYSASINAGISGMFYYDLIIAKLIKLF
jgi:hypothetical protein